MVNELRQIEPATDDLWLAENPAAMFLRGGVIVHCLGGTGRTGTVLGCVLRELEFSADEVVSHLKEVNEARKRTWPESIWQEEMVRSYPCIGD